MLHFIRTQAVKKHLDDIQNEARSKMQMKNHHIKDQKKKQTSDGRKQATKNVYRQTDALTPGPLCHQSEDALERFRFTIYIPDVHQYDMSS